MNTALPDDSTSYRRIERVIAYIDRHHADKPGLEDLAKVAGLSVFHFSREFRRWAGLSPTRYLRTVALTFHGRYESIQSRFRNAVVRSRLQHGNRGLRIEPIAEDEERDIGLPFSDEVQGGE